MSKKKTIIFAIPSLNEHDSIGALTKIIDEGLVKYFPQYNSVILNVDNDSPDGTKEAFLGTHTKNKKVYLSSKGKPRGIRGKGYHMKMALKFAQNQKAAALAFVDGDVVSASPEWVKILLEPILKEKADHVLPVYLRNEFDGSITNHLAFPVLYGLLKKCIRQPLAGEIALSLKAMKTFLKAGWTRWAYHYGVDILFVTESIFHGLEIKQVFLGIKAHKPSAPKLDGMFLEVAGSLFSQLKKHGKEVARLRKKETPPILYPKAPGSLERPKLSFNYEKFKNKTEEKFGALFKISAYEWKEAVYGAAGKKNIAERDLKKLREAFFMRFLTFYNEVKDKSYAEAEKIIKEQAEIFSDGSR